MGNNLDIYAGTGETANEPVPQLDRQTADRPHDRGLNANEKPLEELASTEISKVETASTATQPTVDLPADSAELSPSRQPHSECLSPDRSVTEVTFVPTASRPRTTADTRGRCGVTSGLSRSGRSVTISIPNFTFVALPVPEILGGTLKILGVT